MHKLCLLTAAFTALVYGQTPIIEDVQNAASRVSITALTPQMLFTITGQNLATSTETAGYPLPTTLGGATVTISTSLSSSPPNELSCAGAPALRLAHADQRAGAIIAGKPLRYRRC
jgi:hypothetical protein